jgi:hypothetical protein
MTELNVDLAGSDFELDYGSSILASMKPMSLLGLEAAHLSSLLLIKFHPPWLLCQNVELV